MNGLRHITRDQDDSFVFPFQTKKSIDEKLQEMQQYNVYKPKPFFMSI